MQVSEPIFKDDTILNLEEIYAPKNKLEDKSDVIEEIVRKALPYLQIPVVVSQTTITKVDETTDAPFSVFLEITDEPEYTAEQKAIFYKRRVAWVVAQVCIAAVPIFLLVKHFAF